MCVLCNRQQRCVRAVIAMCHRLERYAAAIILNMLKGNAATKRLHKAIDSALETL